ncbi:kinesin-like protein [Trypanosoma grayi]|uniref:kinesin-like protein n=1 Tax=Trypanosoma grayi TaxID=71804 RepID=UPI0004F444D2|nr:kinesin-like protein [Trypanosoma grayi]KEG11166.1 kinesin-like protein [Trypanosoma grayi]
MLPVPAGRTNFVVAVRCRHLNAHEESIAPLRYPRRSDTHHHCVFFNHTPAVHNASRIAETTHATAVLVDPDSSSDFSPLWCSSRGASPQDQSSSPLLLRLEARELQRALTSKDGVRSFAFDKVFPPASTNEEIYTALVQRLVMAAEHGYNGTFFAYGQTGTGKSYTVFGESTGGSSVLGLSSLVAADLFGQRHRPEWYSNDAGIKQHGEKAIFVSFLELYNERLRDLLVDPATAVSGSSVHSRVGVARYDDLDVVEHPVHGVQVPHLTRERVRCVAELEQLLEEGSRRRTKAATNSNEASSRSHAIVQFTVRQCVADAAADADAASVCYARTGGREAAALRTFLTAKLSMVDLAGSERVTGFEAFTRSAFPCGSVTGGPGVVQRQRDTRRREGSNINRSLLALGNCIKALGTVCRQQQQRQQHQQQRLERLHIAAGAPAASPSCWQGATISANAAVPLEAHVPYRDSKLTRLLKESLGGNTQTVMLATISPSCTSFEETLSTLRYAARARRITRPVNQNIVVDVAEEEVEECMIRGEDRSAAHLSRQGFEADCDAGRRLLLLKLEAEVRSLQTQLHVTEAATEKMGLARNMDTHRDVPFSATEAAGMTRSSSSGIIKGIGEGRLLALYNETRRELQALLQERAAAASAAAKREENTDIHRCSANKELIRELVRKERRNALLQEQHRRIDAFLS